MQSGVAADLGRQRNLFPLPDFSRDGPQGGADEAWTDMANRGIKALNELSGCVNSKHDKKKSTRAQRRCLSYIGSCFKDVFQSADGFDPTDALSELCGTSHIYGETATVVEPYTKERVSWPQVNSEPVGLVDCIPDADSEWLQAWREHMLKHGPGGDDGSVDIQPYIDPILKHNKKEYAGFLKELQLRNMIKFKRVDGYGSQLGIFFVKKKSGQLRLIFDTRKLNQQFIEPPHTDLPSADAFSRVSLPEDSQFYIGSGDLANAFYTLAVPDSLGKMFTLPAVQAAAVGIRSIDDTDLGPGALVVPYLTVLPMGWSWALHLCQAVLDRAIRQTGFNEDSIISDKGMAVNIDGSHVSCAAAAYVDNFAVIGLNRAEVDLRLSEIGRHLRAHGLTVHEEEQAASVCDFTGLHIDGIRGFISIKPSRIHKLQAAISQLLNLQVCNGKTMQHILGHITWSMMTRREGLAILSSVYAFAHTVGQKPQKLWPSVRKELILVRDLLPLFRARVNIGWTTHVTASDSSPWGFGVCSRELPVIDVKSIGQVSERWRYRLDAAVKARQFDLGALSEPGHVSHGLERQQFSMDRS